MCVCVLTQSCLALWNPMDYSPPHSSVHVISQARILVCVAISFFRWLSWPRDRTHVSCMSFFGRQIILLAIFVRGLSSESFWYLFVYIISKIHKITEHILRSSNINVKYVISNIVIKFKCKIYSWWILSLIGFIMDKIVICLKRHYLK